MTRKWGEGSTFQRKDGTWVFQIYTGGRPKQYYGGSPDEARSKAARGPRPKPMPPMPVIPPRPHPILWDRDRSEDKAIARERRAFEIVVTQAILDTAAAHGWTTDHTARVIVAQTSAARIRQRVAGPCVYCGTWIAGTIDHVIPTVRGGADDPSNRVSSCFSCNARKRHRTPEEWRLSA